LASANATGDVKVGDEHFGSLTASIGQSARFSASQTAFANSAGTATIGNVSVGAQHWTVQLDSKVDSKVVIDARTPILTPNTATIGEVTIGDSTASAGVNATFTLQHDVHAFGTAGSLVGNVSIGNASVVADDGAFVVLQNSIQSSGTLSDVTIGGQSVTLGVSATAHITTDVTASAGIGVVSIGSVSIDAGKPGDRLAGDIFINATSTSSDIASVSVGDVSLKGGAEGGTVSNTFDIHVAGAGTVGDVAVGAVTLQGIGDNAQVRLNITDTGAAGGSGTGSATLGNLTVGNVRLTAQGASAHAQLHVTMSNAAKGGTVTLGDIGVTLGAAQATGQAVTVTADNTLGAVKIGNVSINAASRGTSDTVMTYDFHLNVSAATTATIGNITVSGGDKDSSGLSDFAGSVMGGVAAVKTITIGGVDYSGFKAGATIDVSNFAGAASVVGSAFDDVITDNKGTNTLTGGAGADTFTFVTTNTGKTGATGDVITDFSEAGGDRIASGAGAVTAAEYGENTFTDFASFLSGADAADKNVFVGQVGTNLWVAVDSNQDNTVDYTIKLLGVSLAGIDLAAFV
jgi:hypothetical protein